MTFTAIVVSHANERGLRYMLGNLRYQTRRPDNVIAVCSETPGLPRLREDFPDVRFVETQDERDWGHSKRALGIDIAESDWIGFFNDDDSYKTIYIEQMLATAEETGAGAVWCAWNENPGCGFRKFESTAGNFIVRASLARLVGWTERCYEADGIFIDKLVAAGARCVKVDDVLYHHNVQ